MKKFRKRKWVRITAIFLILTMLVTYWAGTVTSIKISAEATNEAMRYLAENTEMMNKQRASRTWNLVRGLMRTEDIDECYLVASIYIGSARYEEALTYIDKCLRMCPQDERADFYAELLTKKGCLLTLLDRNEEALRVLDQATEKKPDASEVYLVKAQINFEENDVDDMAANTSKYLELKPEDVDVRVTYLQTLAAMDIRDEAKIQGKMIVESKDAKVDQKDDAYHVLAMLALREEDFEEALKNLTGIKDEEGRYEDVQYDIGVCKMASGDYEEAIDAFSKSIENDYNKQGCYYSRGVCEFSGEEADYEAAFHDLVAASEYSEEDRDEETAKLAQVILDEAFEVVE